MKEKLLQWGKDMLASYKSLIVAISSSKNNITAFAIFITALCLLMFYRGREYQQYVISKRVQNAFSSAFPNANNTKNSTIKLKWGESKKIGDFVYTVESIDSYVASQETGKDYKMKVYMIKMSVKNNNPQDKYYFDNLTLLSNEDPQLVTRYLSNGKETIKLIEPSTLVAGGVIEGYATFGVPDYIEQSQLKLVVQDGLEKGEIKL